MRRLWVPIVVCVVLLIPTKGNAQAVYGSGTRAAEPAPLVTAANVDWQLRGEPIFYASNFYWPSGPDIFFDGAVLVRTGQYEGIPLYTDPFLPSYNVVYVPIGDNAVRPYVRRPPEAGRIGSAGAPSPNLALRGERVVVAGDTGPVRPIVTAGAVSPRATAGAVGTSGVVMPRATAGDETLPVESTRARRTTMATVTPPRGRNGIWLMFGGAKYYGAGPAVPFSPDRFIPIGSHEGFLMYRDKQGRPDEIYVTAVKDGPLAPYRR